MQEEIKGTEMSEVVQDDFPAELAAQQDFNFRAKMHQFNLIGELTNWRTNMKDNTRRSKILAGHNKIMDICFGKV